MKIKKDLDKFWNWLWNSESIWSYLVFLILVFVFIKFIFLPGLGLIFGTSLPLAIVESSSMDHHSLKIIDSNYEICGTIFPTSSYFNSEKYWETCGNWYKQNTNITQEQFSKFSFKNGFRKGDIMIIFKKKTIEIGDVLVFESSSQHPIIHRIISLNPIQTKGD
ncbi:MAG: S26 family signal peptidase, partial [archaeon]|nr:S26 family signal peptidase [archaeon]